VYQTAIGFERLARAFEVQGYTVTSLLSSLPQALAPDDPVMAASRRVGHRQIRFNLKAAAFNQVQYELFSPECLAEAFDEVIGTAPEWWSNDTEGLLAHGSLAFAHERAVWTV
jgi:hypothetical protein